MSTAAGEPTPIHKVPRLAHFGGFDVENYGDILFPLVAEAALPGWAITHVAPVGGASPFTDGISSVSLASAQEQSFDAVLIGGGNIIDVSPNVVPRYRGVHRTAYASLWVGAAALACRQRVPLVYGAPGVRDLGTFKPLVRSAVDAANLIALRDSESKRLLDPYVEGREIVVVPDTALGLPAVWSYEELTELHERRFGSRTVAIHLNARYLGMDPHDAAALLDQVAGELQARPILLAIGRCHGDDLLARAVGARMSSQPFVLDEPRELREIAAAIAGSVAYAGSSMHGLITACAYGRPCVAVVGSTPPHKFAGFLSQLSATDRLLPDWHTVLSTVSLLRSAPKIDDAVTVLDAHWDRVRTALTAGPRGNGTWILRGWKPVVTATNGVTQGAARLRRALSAARLQVTRAPEARSGPADVHGRSGWQGERT